MAYVFGFPPDVTALIYSMRDWRWEMVRQFGKAPSALCFNTSQSRGVWLDDKPFLLPMMMPSYAVESDSESSDFGEIVLDHWNRREVRGVTLEVWNPVRDFRLRKHSGEAPAGFRRLQKQNDKRIRDMWFQCEPCA